MPFARRTADRLWIDAAGNAVAGATTRGDELIGQLNALYASQNSTTKVVKPGTPSLQIAQFPAPGSGGSGADVLSFVPLNAVSLPLDDGFPQAALLLPQPTWQVCVDVNSGSCSGSANVVSVVGSNEIPAVFQIPHSGNYLAELDSAGSLVTVAPLSVAAVLPVIHDLTGTVKRQNSIALAGASVITPGNGPLSAHFWWLSDVSNLVVTMGANCTSSASQCSVMTSPFVLSETDATASSASYTINVVDADGSPVVTAVQPVSITSSLSATIEQDRFAGALRRSAPTGTLTVLQSAKLIAGPSGLTGTCWDPVDQLLFVAVSVPGAAPFVQGLNALKIQDGCGQSPLSVAWKTTAYRDGAPFTGQLSSPTVAGGLAWFGVSGLVETSDRLMAVAAANGSGYTAGQVMWQSKPLKCRPVEAPPTVVNGRVYVTCRAGDQLNGAGPVVHAFAL